MQVHLKRSLWAPTLLALLAGCTGADALAKKGPTANQGALGAIAVEDNRSAWVKMSDSVGSAFGGAKQQTAKESPETSLSNIPPTNPALCVQVAQLHERSGNHAAAATQYQRALKADPNHLDALLGYARMNDRLGQRAQALQLYQAAAGKHPANATAHNDLAICLTNSGQLDAAVASMNTAVKLQPAHALYRNNLATILVKQGRSQEAFQSMSAVHPPAVAHYNLAYLLRREGKLDAAKHHFAQAVQADPAMAEAKQHLAELSGPTHPTVAQGPASPGVAQPVSAIVPGAQR